MDAIFMNSKNRKISNLHRQLLTLSNKQTKRKVINVIHAKI